MNKLSVYLAKDVVNKILWMSEKNHSEILGLGVAKSKEEPLVITDFFTMKQEVTSSTVDVDDLGFATLINQLTEVVEPIQLRVWIHTHPFPGKPTPSSTDWGTFKVLHNCCSWSVMVIISKDCEITGYLVHQDFPNQAMEVSVEVFDPTNDDKLKKWEEELKQNIKTKTCTIKYSNRYYDPCDSDEYLQENYKGVVVINEKKEEKTPKCYTCDFPASKHCSSCGTPYCSLCATYLIDRCPTCGTTFCEECSKKPGQCPKCNTFVMTKQV